MTQQEAIKKIAAQLSDLTYITLAKIIPGTKKEDIHTCVTMQNIIDTVDSDTVLCPETPSRGRLLD